MEDNVVKLSDKTNDNRYISVKSVLEEAIKDCDDEFSPDSVVVILLHKKEGVYATRMLRGNLSNSEAVSLLELRKSMLVDELK